MTRGTLAALLAAAIALALYFTTLLPGQDFGDTASFQATAGERTLTPRDGYPLYFAIGDAVLWTTGAEPARALNLASAVEGGVAVGLVTMVALTLCGSPLLALASGLLFASSYTFWSQAIIAEVYALHAVFVSLTLWLLLRWHARPTTGRLAVFFAAYALGFGNHLSMILLAPAYTFFLLAAAPRGWRSMFAPSMVALAVALAAAGALQYVWNLQALRLGPHPPQSIADALRAFWFDVTKTDWRESMVLRVPESARTDRLAMYWFDLRQQVGWPAVVVAACGAAAMVSRSWRIGVMLLLVYAVNAVFAFTYNVGDTHVFYLPSHLCVALLAATGGTALRPPPLRAAAAGVLIVYAGVRAYEDYPALDRSRDRRPGAVLAGLTAGMDDLHSIANADANWQVQNGLAYFARHLHPEIAYTTTADVLLYAPELIADNAAIGREVLATARARAALGVAYGPLLQIDEDRPAEASRGPRSLAEAVRDLPANTRYVVTMLRPSRDATFDASDVESMLRSVTGGRITSLPASDYVAVAGFAGAAPSYIAASAKPFRRRIDLAGTTVEIRMESWLASDTIRRMGFGHVIAGRRHTLIIERGVSFVAFDERGEPRRTAYAANIVEPQRRFSVQLKK